MVKMPRGVPDNVNGPYHVVGRNQRYNCHEAVLPNRPSVVHGWDNSSEDKNSTNASQKNAHREKNNPRKEEFLVVVLCHIVVCTCVHRRVEFLKELDNFHKLIFG